MNSDLKEIVWPPMGFIYDQEFMLPAFCKPKLCPLKSITLEKLEKMQRESLEKLKEMDQTQITESKQAEQSTSAAGTGIPPENVKTEIWKADDESAEK